MSVTITRQDPHTLLVQVQHARIDGENIILSKLKEGGVVTPDIDTLIMDFDEVGYLNSLGITEMINIHRLVTETAGDQVKFQFRNVARKVLSILELVELHKVAEIIPKVSE